jgi:hypothetical protein
MFLLENTDAGVCLIVLCTHPKLNKEKYFDLGKKKGRPATVIPMSDWIFHITQINTVNVYFDGMNQLVVMLSS